MDIQNSEYIKDIRKALSDILDSVENGFTDQAIYDIKLMDKMLGYLELTNLRIERNKLNREISSLKKETLKTQ